MSGACSARQNSCGFVNGYSSTTQVVEKHDRKYLHIRGSCDTIKKLFDNAVHKPCKQKYNDPVVMYSFSGIFLQY